MGFEFWKIVQPYNLPPKPLDIPRGFALDYFLNVPCSIIVVAPNGMECVMKVEKRGQSLFITEGWTKFFSFFKVMLYHRLLFSYIGEGKFLVKISSDSWKMKNYHVDDKLVNPVRKLSSVRFIVSNFPCFFEFGRIMIPKKFNGFYGPNIPNNIVLITSNGDRWFCAYDYMSCQIVGLESFMNFFGVSAYWFMVITYFGDDEFGVNIYSPNCCEILYSKILHDDANIEKKEMVDSFDHSVVEEKDGALLLFNVSWSDFRFFRLVILSVHLNELYDKVPICEDMYTIFKNWSSGERIILRLLNKCWEIEIEWCNYYCMFGMGWSNFVKEADIRLGDICIFECTGKRLEFNICIERHEDHDFMRINSDLCGVRFFQIVFFQTLAQEKIVLPISLRDSLGMLLSAVVEFLMPSKKTWSICYQRESSSFILTKEFASFYGVKENYIVVFEFLGDSRFFVRIFDPNSLEISYFKLCKSSKRVENFLKSEYQFGFVKGHVIDVIGLRNIKGIVEEYAEILEKANEYPNLLSLCRRNHFFGRFVIVLGSLRINHKLHNVYIGDFSRSLSKDWINGSVSKLIAHKRQWRVVIKVKHNMCKLGRGWDKFIGDNDLGAGDLCIFNLLDCARKIFRVDVIRV